jgi:hypothetical protein
MSNMVNHLLFEVLSGWPASAIQHVVSTVEIHSINKRTKFLTDHHGRHLSVPIPGWLAITQEGTVRSGGRRGE